MYPGLVFRPSGPYALLIFNFCSSFVTPLGSTVVSSTAENGLSPFDGRSESVSRVKADWNCLLTLPALSCTSVFRIPLSVSEVIPNVSFFKDLTNDQNLLIFSFLLGLSGYRLSSTKVKVLDTFLQCASGVTFCSCALNRL